MNNPKISLLMAAYNAEKYIDEAIISVKNQKYNNWELIIVNDGSTDNTEECVKKYLEDHRIKYYMSEHLGTAAKVRNVALEFVTGDYVQMIDSDDYLSVDFLQEYVNRLNDGDYDIIVPDAVSITDSKVIIWEKRPVNNDYYEVLDGERAFLYSLDWRIHGVMLIKTRIIKQIGYDIELINGDEFTTRKLFYASDTITFSKGVYYYRMNLQSTTLNEKNQIRMLKCIKTDIKIYNFCIDNNMSKNCIKLAERKLICENVSKQSKFSCVKNYLSDDEVVEIEQYLKSAFEIISLKMLIRNFNKYTFLYILSFGSYKLFGSIVKVLTNIKNKMRKNKQL